MPLLKVCGMNDGHNISELIKIRPDFIGFIFHERSPRNVSTQESIHIPSEISSVGVFVNESQNFIIDKIQKFNLKYIQLHGKESPRYCQEIKHLNLKVIKAFNVHLNFDFSELEEYSPHCDYFLFDAFGENAGGNGITFDWDLLNKYKGTTPFLLSGGINSEMAKSIKAIKHPMFKGVDINSKFEIKPGIKSIEKIKNFKNELRS